MLLFGSSSQRGLRFGTWTYTPASGLTVPKIDWVINPPGSRNVFCSGHSVLPGGELLIVGGEMGRSDLGSDRSYIFDPTHPAGQQWSLLGSRMAQYRWYPSINTLDDGRALAFSGDQYSTLLTFGGTDGSPENNFDAMWQPSVPFWKTTLAELAADSIPEARYGHTLTHDQFGDPAEHGSTILNVLYGGRGLSGGADAYFDSIWVMTQLSVDTTWKWTREQPANDAAAGHPASPAKRYRHSAMVADDNAIYIYGGFDQYGQALNDLWKLSWNGTFDPTWQWTFITNGPGPGPRAGHAAVFDPDNRRIMVFGGARDVSGTLASDTVWAWPLGVGSPAWTAPALRTGGAGPGAREGHGMVADIYEQQRAPSGSDEHRAILFGGQASGTLVNDDPWFLWFGHATDSRIEWQRITNASGTAPSPRSYFGAVYDLDWRRMTIFGGDSVLAGPVRSNWTYALDVSPLQWESLSPKTGSPMPSRQSGSAIALDRHDIQARIPEKFGLHDGIGGVDAWTVLGSAEREQDNYPFMFEMPNGKLLDAGPVIDPARLGHFTELNLATGTWVDSLTDTSLPGTAKMGSAVMYRPGRVLRCGSRNPDDGATGSNQTDTLECLLGSVKGWRTIANLLSGQMDPRDEPNLTVLPTGQVLVTGGMSDGTAQKAPQIWSPGTAVWSNPLAPDSAKRNYHSAAILLPDARVLSSGGENPTPDRYNVTIYDPPYLFDDSGGVNAILR